jgi:pimeloyl-ACP methyl ester carboxylesterase
MPDLPSRTKKPSTAESITSVETINMRTERHSGPRGSFRRLSREFLGKAFPEINGTQLSNQADSVADQVKRARLSDGLATGVEEQSLGRPRLPGRFAIVAGVTGPLIGALVGLALLSYSSLAALIVGALSSGVASLAAYGGLLRRRQLTGVVEGVIQITADTLHRLEMDNDNQNGALLHYLEAKRDSEDLLVLVHGLGLDATDFRTYLAETRYHAIALTLYGFNVDERDDDDYSPISLTTHARLFALALRKLQTDHPGKRLSLVGFSVGADIILMLSELAGDVLQGLNFHRVLLLDPNVNEQTTTISTEIAKIDSKRPLNQFLNVLNQADNLDALIYRCEYVVKAAKKDIAQIQRHASDISTVWDEPSTDRFIGYLARLSKVSGGIYVVLSLGQKELLENLQDRAIECGLSQENFRWAASGHFELLDPSFLRRQLDLLLR